jgi:RNA polymerase sigma-70 factor, ECF subfamily
VAYRSDEELMQELGAGKVKALDVLLERYKEKMLTFLSLRTGNASLAEDLFQEVFLRVYQARRSYQPTAKFSTWLYTIAQHLCIDAGRRSSRNPTISLEKMQGGESEESSRFRMEQLASEEKNPLQKAEYAQKNEIVHQALSALPEDQRTLLFLSSFAGLSYKEIAGVLNCSMAALKVRIFRAHQALRDKLKNKREDLI